MWFQRNFLPFYRVNFGFPVESNSRSLSIFVFSPGIKVFATLCVCVCACVCVCSRIWLLAMFQEVPSTLLIWVGAFVSLECPK